MQRWLPSIAIPHGINGNNFTASSQIPVIHDAGGNTLIELGAPGNLSSQIILLAGTAGISPSSMILT